MQNRVHFVTGESPSFNTIFSQNDGNNNNHSHHSNSSNNNSNNNSNKNSNSNNNNNNDNNNLKPFYEYQYNNTCICSRSCNNTPFKNRNGCQTSPNVMSSYQYDVSRLEQQQQHTHAGLKHHPISFATSYKDNNRRLSELSDKIKKQTQNKQSKLRDHKLNLSNPTTSSDIDGLLARSERIFRAWERQIELLRNSHTDPPCVQDLANGGVEHSPVKSKQINKTYQPLFQTKSVQFS